MKLRKRFISALVVLVLVLQVLPLSVSASSTIEPDVDVSYQALDSGLPQVDKAYANANAYQEDISMASKASVNLSTMKTNQGTTTIELEINNQAVSFEGILYSFDGGLIVGDFSPSMQYNIAQFRVLEVNTYDENHSEVYVLIENLNDGSIVESSFAITTSDYQSLLTIANENTDCLISTAERNNEDYRLTVYPQLLALLQPNKQYMYSENAPASTYATTSLQSSCKFESTSTYSAVGASYENELKPFFDSLESSNTTSASSTMDSVLCQTGWKMYKTSTYFYVMHGVQNTSTEQLVGITVVSVSSERVSSNSVINADIYILYSYTLSYNKTTGTATVLQRDSGIRLEDAIVAIQLVGGTTNFWCAQYSFNLTRKASALGLFIAIAEDLASDSSIFTVLQLIIDGSSHVGYQYSSGYESLGDDTAQIRRYGGLYRGVATKQGSDGYLWGKGEKTGVSGQYYSDKTYISYRSSYAFTAYSLL